ncbi:MAG: PEFG-CTERM sorting domain-containing protein [Nitrosopumilus sp.]
MTSKTILVFLIAVSFVSTSAFAESSIEVDASPKSIKSLDTVVITGQITDVSTYKPVKITVKNPEGEVVYAPLVPIKGEGEFRRVLQPTLPSFQTGTYTVIVSHEDTQVTAQTQFKVTAQEIPRGIIEQSSPETAVPTEKSSSTVGTGKIVLSADAINGSDTIKINGNTSILDTDVALVVSSPNGNVVTIAQTSPDSFGNFEIEIKTGGSMWKQDGVYVITANQGIASEHKQMINVEIKDGLVVPEFGVIASTVLAISIFAIVILSTKSKLSIIPRY